MHLWSHCKKKVMLFLSIFVVFHCKCLMIIKSALLEKQSDIRWDEVGLSLKQGQNGLIQRSSHILLTDCSCFKHFVLFCFKTFSICISSKHIFSKLWKAKILKRSFILCNACNISCHEFLNLKLLWTHRSPGMSRLVIVFGLLLSCVFPLRRSG